MSVNKNYEQDLHKVKKAYIKGTPERTKRLSYPGKAIPRCEQPECANRALSLIKLGCITYSLCDPCRSKVPNANSFYKFAATKVIIPKIKLHQQSITTFTAYCTLREKEELNSIKGFPT
jgi:hypothetical protein